MIIEINHHCFFAPIVDTSDSGIVDHLNVYAEAIENLRARDELTFFVVTTNLQVKIVVVTPTHTGWSTSIKDWGLDQIGNMDRDDSVELVAALAHVHNTGVSVIIKWD